MGFFDEMKGSLSNVGMGISQKANEMSGSVKVTLQIKEEEKQLQENLTNLGKTMFESHSEDAKRLCPDIYNNIIELNKKIADDKKELAICKGMKICPNCGAEQYKEAVNCTVCGMNMQDAANIISNMNMASQEKVCPSCGMKITEGAKFCAGCGTRIEN